MPYAIDDAQQYNDFLVGQFGVGPVVTAIKAEFNVSFPILADTQQGTGANLEVLHPVSNEISVTTTAELNQVVDHDSSTATEDFDVNTHSSFLEIMLTAPNVDFSLTGPAASGNLNFIFAGAGNDTIDASGSTDVNGIVVYTGSGNETVTGSRGSDTFYVNKIPGFDAGTTNTISITGGSAGGNYVDFNDQISDASISTVAGVTTVDFVSGQNAGQVDTLTNVQAVAFG